MCHIDIIFLEIKYYWRFSPLWRPIIKSLKNIAAKGAKIANSLLSSRAPANTAIPNNGVKFGRKPIDDKVVKKIKQLFTGGMSIAQISLTLALGKSTIYRLLKQ